MSDDATVREVAGVLAYIAHDSAESGEYDDDAREVIEWLIRWGWTPPNAKADA